MFIQTSQSNSKVNNTVGKSSAERAAEAATAAANAATDAAMVCFFLAGVIAILATHLAFTKEPTCQACAACRRECNERSSDQLADKMGPAAS